MAVGEGWWPALNDQYMERCTAHADVVRKAVKLAVDQRYDFGIKIMRHVLYCVIFGSQQHVVTQYSECW